MAADAGWFGMRESFPELVLTALPEDARSEAVSAGKREARLASCKA
jgi:hypothetical protein